jgi:hypothetical protein
MIDIDEVRGEARDDLVSHWYEIVKHLCDELEAVRAEVERWKDEASDIYRAHERTLKRIDAKERLRGAEADVALCKAKPAKARAEVEPEPKPLEQHSVGALCHTCEHVLVASELPPWCAELNQLATKAHDCAKYEQKEHPLESLMEKLKSVGTFSDADFVLLARYVRDNLCPGCWKLPPRGEG